MKVHEYAKANGMTNDEVKAKFGLKSHLSLIPAEGVSKAVGKPVVAPSTVSVAPEAISEPCPVSIEDLKQSIQIHGSGSPVYKWRHLINGN